MYKVIIGPNMLFRGELGRTQSNQYIAVFFQWFCLLSDMSGLGAVKESIY